MTRNDNHWLTGTLPILMAIALGLVLGIANPEEYAVWFVVVLPFALLLASKYPEAVLAAFLYSGFFKAGLVLPVDLTVLLGLLVIGLSVRSVAVNGPPDLQWVALLFALVIAVVGIGLIGSATPYAIDKAGRFAVLGSIAFFGAASLVRDRPAVRKFAGTAILLGAILSLDAIAGGLGQAVDQVRLTAFGANTIALGRVAAITLVGALTYTLWNRSAMSWALPVMLLASLALIGSGSRGPLMAVLIALGILGSYRLYTKGARRFTVGATLGAAGLGAYVLWELVPDAAIARLASMISGAPGTADPVRISLYEQAISLWLANPVFGAGTGAFADIAPAQYPHNIFLELASENGLFGLVSFSIFAVAVFVRAVHLAWIEPCFEYDFLMAGLILAFVNASVSGDLNDNRILYAFAAIVSTTAVRNSLGHGRSMVSSA